MHYDFIDVAFMACQRGLCDVLHLALETNMPVSIGDCALAGAGHENILRALAALDGFVVPEGLFAACLRSGSIGACAFVYARSNSPSFSQRDINTATRRGGPAMYWWISENLDSLCSIETLGSSLFAGDLWDEAKRHRIAVAALRRERLPPEIPAYMAI